MYINTIMKKQPSPEGWIGLFADSTVFAEFNSRNGMGKPIDLSTRYTTQIKDGERSKQYTVENVLSGSDNWKPESLTKQVNAR